MADLNLYEELQYLKGTEALLDISVTDPAKVIAAIDAKIQFYSKNANNPKYRAIGPVKKKELTDLKTRVASDPSIITAHRNAFKEIKARKEAEALKAIIEEGMLMVSNGTITEASLRALATKYKKTEAEILKMLGVQVRTIRTFPPDDLDKYTETAPQIMASMVDHLALLKKKNLYDFLEVSPNGPLPQIQAAIKGRLTWVAGNSNKTDPTVNAIDQLAKAANGIFGSEASRKGYDKALANAGFATVRDSIQQLAAGGRHVITPDQYRRMLDTATTRGIPKERAERLIYETAKKVGMDVDEGDIGKSVICRYCGTVNDPSATVCRGNGCGMPLKVVCPNPKCGHPSADDDYTCTKCGFSLINMREAPVMLRTAREHLDRNELEAAKTAFQRAADYWPNNPDLKKIFDLINAKQSSMKGIIEAIENDCKAKRYYSAKRNIGALPTGSPLRSEILMAVDNADKMVAQAKAATDGAKRLDLLLQALSYCADCADATAALSSITIPAPTALNASVNGSNVRLGWTKTASARLKYLVVRKEKAAPSGPNDGSRLAETAQDFYDDASATPGVSYYYAVYSTYEGKTSQAAAVTASPVLIALDMAAADIKADTDETTLTFSFNRPQGASAIEVIRDGKPLKKVLGTTFSDTGLTTGRNYNYGFITVFTDCAGREHRSKGIAMSFAPMAKPKAAVLTLTNGTDRANLAWNNPGVGTVAIFWSDTPFKLNPNDIVSVDTFRANRLSVAGNMCTVNKDFSGIRYYIPITIQGNIGVAGNMQKIASLAPLSDVDISRTDREVTVSWKWASVSDVRVDIRVDGVNKTYKFNRGNCPSAECRQRLPDKCKSVYVKIAPIINDGGNELEGKSIEKVFNLSASRVRFLDVDNLKKLGFLPSDNYEVSLVTDAQLPCDLHVLVREDLPPTDLVNYRPQAVIRANDLVPNEPFKVKFSYTRRMKGKPLYVRIIAADRSLKSQVSISPESRSL